MEIVTFVEWEVGNWYIYPEGFKEVLGGSAYWYDNPIQILGYENIYYYYQEYEWRKIDTKHPKCGFCGKFVKAGNWWKGEFTMPCLQCGEPLWDW